LGVGRHRVVNLETGLPTVEVARKRMSEELTMAKRQGFAAVKIIHGYGSSGTGGKLKSALRQSLGQRQRDGKIRGFVAGEEWNIFEDGAREALDRCPELSRDPDLNRRNSGITIVLL
jgi:hypothetical protein